MRRVDAQFQQWTSASVHRVVNYAELAREWHPELRLLVKTDSEDERRGVEQLRKSGVDNIYWVSSSTLQDGDVAVPQPEKSRALVLLRESDSHHALLLTNRCNSYCVMCSQPPTPQKDDWLVAEALDAIRHLRTVPQTFGLTGGEPLLLGSRLRKVLDAVFERNANCCVEVLTNGRLLEDGALASELMTALPGRVRWLVPLYGHADFLHDFVVQSVGAFDQTIEGLLALRSHGQEIQLRIVLVEPVLRVLPALAEFIGRNLPFVQEVALMGVEPTGFALANRALCEVNLHEWGSTLVEASRVLKRHQMRHLFMNTPLCSLPQPLRSRAHQSISDWKNVFAAPCSQCAARNRCSGLFAWHKANWSPAPLVPLTLEESL